MRRRILTPATAVTQVHETAQMREQRMRLHSPPAPGDVRPGKPGTKPQKIAYGDGLFLFVTPRGRRTDGTKSWRCKYWLDKTEHLILLGKHPEMSEEQARIARNAVRNNTAHHIDSRLVKRAEAARDQQRRTQTFEPMARAWFETHKADWHPRYATQMLQRFEAMAFPAISGRPVADITTAEIVDLLQAVKRAHGGHQMTHLRQHFDSAFGEWAFNGLTNRNPVADIAKHVKGLAPPPRNPHPAAETIEDARIVLDAMERRGTRGLRQISLMVLLYHRFLALTGLRSQEVCRAEWGEFRSNVWTVQAERMKGRPGRKQSHTVFLSRQAQDLLWAARILQGGEGNGLVFAAGARAIGRSTLSEIMKARMVGVVGSDGAPLQHVPHGWRACMSTILNERHPDEFRVIDAMLAHATKGKVEGLYNRTRVETHYRIRVTQLAQEWSDMLLEGACDAFALVGLERPASNVIPMLGPDVRVYAGPGVGMTVAE